MISITIGDDCWRFSGPVGTGQHMCVGLFFIHGTD